MEESIIVQTPPGVLESDRSGSPWGVWATLGFSAIIAAVALALGMALGIGFAEHAYSKDPQLDIEEYAARLASNGLFISVVTLVTGAAGSALVILFAWLRRQMKVTEYLGLKPVPRAVLFRWILVLAGLVIVWDVSNFFIGRQVVPKFMIDAYLTAGLVPLFWLAIVLAAPIFEELFFRGFLFAGLASRLGPAWAIGLTAATWAALHKQYGIYEILAIAVAGVVLGIARLQTKSLYPPLVMHAFLNLIATTEVWLVTRTIV